MMSAVKDLTGQEFGRLTVLRRNGSSARGKARWLCACSCGNEATIAGPELRGGHTRSCGCLFVEAIRSPECKRHTHRLTDTPIYVVWRNMLARCTNPRHKSFPDYGGRGIKVCAEWQSFECFYGDFGHSRPTLQHTIDRRDNDGDYHPGNVRWALQVEQANHRRSNVRITYCGETLTVTQWSRRVGISAACLFHRFRNGWPTGKALTLPPDSGRRVLAQRRPA